jgi:epoxyqueuosine reductase QueG
MLSSLSVKERAIELGFDLAGIAPIGVWKDLEFSRRWVEKGFNGEMRYLENPKRFDPHLVLPSAKSIICLGLVYNTSVPYSTGVGAASGGSQKSLSRSQKSEAGSQNKEEREFEGPTQSPVAGSRPPVTGNNGQRTTDNGRPALSSFQFPISSFGSPVSSFELPVSIFHFPVSAAAAPRAWISRYAWGQDYHEIMRAKLEQLCGVLEELAPGVETRVFVDTGPVVERAFARFSGIGWMGKNTCIINQDKGSWFFLGVILTSLELAPDLPAPDRCGSCTACLDACPTEALVEPYVMNASRCISYFTIEIKGAIPEQFRPKIGANVFGCDICQDVCPWNRETSRQLSVVSCQSQNFSHQPSAISYQQSLSTQRQSPDERCVKQAAITRVPQFHSMTFAPICPELVEGSAHKQLTTDNGPLTTGTPSFSLFNPPLDVLALISEDDFRRIFAHSPIKRAKYRGWLRNLCVAMGNSSDERFVPWLEQAAQHSDPAVREHATWALDRLRNK